MASTKASRDGLIQIKRAMAQKGWTISDVATGTSQDLMLMVAVGKLGSDFY